MLHDGLFLDHYRAEVGFLDRGSHRQRAMVTEDNPEAVLGSSRLFDLVRELGRGGFGVREMGHVVSQVGVVLREHGFQRVPRRRETLRGEWVRMDDRVNVRPAAVDGQVHHNL